MSRYDSLWNFVITPLSFAVGYWMASELTGYLPSSSLTLALSVFIIVALSAMFHRDERVDP